MILCGKQDINQDDINSVIDALQSDFLTQGPKLALFEKAVSSYCGAKVDFVDIAPKTYNLSSRVLDPDSHFVLLQSIVSS